MSKSNEYWESRYKSGGNSGAGSYGEYAEHKANVINNYITKYNIKTISDFGCGDGNQISLLKGYVNYNGYDVSKYVVEKCKQRFIGTSMLFYDDILKLPEAELCLSLDVLYHIVDESDYIFYLDLLFSKSKRYALIYSSNHDWNKNEPDYIFHRKFTDWVDKHYQDFILIEEVGNTLKTAAQFYLYERIIK
jgi:SAM-dependent methyltransferase